MTHGKMVLVECGIERAAFSGERVIHLSLTGDSREDYSGVAALKYCRAANDYQPLAKDQPKPGTRINGFVEAFVVSNGGEHATVELPGGDVVRVKVTQVPVELQKQGEKYVPIGS